MTKTTKERQKGAAQTTVLLKGDLHWIAWRAGQTVTRESNVYGPMKFDFKLWGVSLLELCFTAPHLEPGTPRLRV